MDKRELIQRAAIVFLPRSRWNHGLAIARAEGLWAALWAAGYGGPPGSGPPPGAAPPAPGNGGRGDGDEDD